MARMAFAQHKGLCVFSFDGDHVCSCDEAQWPRVRGHRLCFFSLFPLSPAGVFLCGVSSGEREANGEF